MSEIILTQVWGLFVVGIINKEVEVKINVKNIKYYEDLGYKIPRYYNKKSHRTLVKRGTKITVKIEDLPKGSTVKIKAKCDECGCEKDITYQSYINCYHNGKHYCHKCANKVLTSGKNHHRWNPNLTDEERENGRANNYYINFVNNVFKRDKYTCQCCGDNKGHNLNAHHLDSYNWCKEKRTDETNGITLCEECHKEFHRIYGYGNNTKEQFEEFIKNKKLEESA